MWWRHYRFFRTYDLEDGYIVVLTGMLLFVVLFFVYPLKFMWSLPFAGIQGTRITDEVITEAQVPVLFQIYGAGVVATFGILTAMYAHAYRLREQLGLTPDEVIAAKVLIFRNLGVAAIGAASIAIALLAPRFAPARHQLGGFHLFRDRLRRVGAGRVRGADEETAGLVQQVLRPRHAPLRFAADPGRRDRRRILAGADPLQHRLRREQRRRFLERELRAVHLRQR